LNCIIRNGLIYKILQFVSPSAGKFGEFSGSAVAPALFQGFPARRGQVKSTPCRKAASRHGVLLAAGAFCGSADRSGSHPGKRHPAFSGGYPAGC
jgi:hypothetical protein